MTRDEKAALRAKARELRRHPQPEQGDDEPDEEEPAEEPRQNKKSSRETRTRPQRETPRGASGDQFEEVADQARRLLRSLRGVDAESVSGISRTANGWKVTLEVVEMRRIPESTDVLASYEVELDGDGDFLGFERGGRYHRSQAQNGGSR
jgi:Gas vesicle synthesis protein GvpO